jgi:3-hydroxyisobutyrate dehydrogenase-like beta-hydroxyacid dehydrogenase
MCVADQAAMRSLLAKPGALDALAGRTLVQLTTGSASDARRNAAAAGEHGIRYLDGAIMAYPRAIGTAEAVILYGGASETFEAADALLGQLGTARYVGEDAGRPAVLDAALIALFHATLAGLLHGAILADAENIELEGFFELASPFFDGFITDAVRETMERIVAGRYGDAQSSMYMHLSGIDHLVVGASREAGVEHGVMDEIQALFAQAVDAGRGDDDIAVVFDVARARRAPGG